MRPGTGGCLLKQVRTPLQSFYSTFPMHTMSSNQSSNLHSDEIQHQAKSQLGRRLTDDEIAFVIHRAPDGMDRTEAICIALGML